MPHVYCVHWSANDAQRGAKPAGWSLHLSRADAAAYIATHEARYAGHDEPRCLAVPEEVLESVRMHREGMFWAMPLPCPFPAVDFVVEQERALEVSRELPGDAPERDEREREPVVEEEEREQPSS